MKAKVDYKKELRFIFVVVTSSVLLGIIFCTVWVIKKIKEGVL